MSWRLGFASGCLFSLQAVNISAAANPKNIFFILFIVWLNLYFKFVYTHVALLVFIHVTLLVYTVQR